MNLEKMNTIKFKKLSKNAITPIRGSPHSAGLDLFSAESKIIGPRDRARIKTDIAIKLPPGTYGRIAPRSGLAANHFIGIGGGVIDPDFVGGIECILFNHQNSPFQVTKGMRISQLIIEKISYPELLEVDVLEETERGVNGFGSSGD